MLVERRGSGSDKQLVELGLPWKHGGAAVVESALGTAWIPDSSSATSANRRQESTRLSFKLVSSISGNSQRLDARYSGRRTGTSEFESHDPAVRSS